MINNAIKILEIVFYNPKIFFQCHFICFPNDVFGKISKMKKSDFFHLQKWCFDNQINDFSNPKTTFASWKRPKTMVFRWKCKKHFLFFFDNGKNIIVAVVVVVAGRVGWQGGGAGNTFKMLPTKMHLFSAKAGVAKKLLKVFQNRCIFY